MLYRFDIFFLLYMTFTKQLLHEFHAFIYDFFEKVCRYATCWSTYQPRGFEDMRYIRTVMLH